MAKPRSGLGSYVWSRWGLAGTALLVAACVTRSEVPKASNMHLLSPRSGETARAADAPFSVVHYGPEGEATSDAVVNVVFSKAMRVLDGTDVDQSVPVVIEPPVAGKWQWVGTNGVQFQPTGGSLPLGKRFRVEVSTNAKSLDGQELGAPLHFSFTTPTPALVSHEPSDGQRSIELRPHIVLDFDQKVAAKEIEKSVEVSAAGQPVKFSVQPGKENEPRRWVLTPAAELPKGTAIRVEVKPGLHSIEGDVPSTHQRAFTFHTYGPLNASVRCGWSECAPETNVNIEFSNPVRLGQLKSRVSITPPAKLEWPEWYGDTDESTAYGIGFSGKPRTQYQVSIAPGVEDTFGQSLQGARQFSFTTGDYWESLAIGADGEVLQPTALRALPIRSRNVGEYELNVAAVEPAFTIAYQERPWEIADGILERMPSVTVRPGITNRFYDHLVDLSVPLTRNNNTAPRGAIFASASYASRNGYPSTDRKLLQVTDLAITGKLSRGGSLVWVTRLSTGASVPGATVELWENGAVKKSYTADAQGVVVLPKDDYTPRFYDEERRTGFVARHESDWVAQSERTFLGAWRMPIYPTLYRTSDREAFLFTERGVYRPGDKVWVKGIVREHADASGAVAGGMKIVSGHTFRLVLRDPNDQELEKHELTTNSFGTFARQVTIPASVELGMFRVQLLDAEGADGEDVSATSFAVAEYEPAEFAVDATASAKQYLNGESARFETEASFLYGAPVANADVHYTLSYEPTSFRVPGADEYETSDVAYRSGIDSESSNSGMLAEGDGKLDGRGRWALTAKASIPSQIEPVNVRFETSVTDVTRKTISGSALTLVHPAEFYVGIQRPEDWFVDAPSVVSPQIAAFDISGKRLSGKVIALELLHRRWTSVKEQWDGGYRQVYQRVDDVVDKCSVTSATGDQTCPLKVSEGGAYVIRAKSKDDAGRMIYASREFYAIGGGRVAWRDDAQNATIELVPNKKVYRIGETARVLVKSPFKSGEALVTVERAGILERRRVTLTGATPVIEVPVTERLRPNAYVSVHLLKKREPNAPPASAGDELYRIGYAELAVDASERVLDVTVTPKAGTVRPKDKVEVDVLVKDSSGRPSEAEVTFYAVDEGVLMLTGYQVPDPVGRFTAPRPLQVATVESRADLARIFEPSAMLGSEKGAEGGGGGDVRSDFKQSAYFNPTLTTDANGRAHVSFQAPDNLTTFRLMAVAVSRDDRYGKGLGRVTVNKPLMARPALPRFLRAGDHFEAAVAVSTKGSSSRSVNVSLEVGAGLVLHDEAMKRIDVERDGVREVRFKVEAAHTGDTTLQFSAVGAKERDVVRLQRVIQTPARVEAVAAYGETKGVDGQRLGELQDVRPDVGGLELTLSSSRLVGLDGSMEQLVEYPYLCTEQLTSRLLPVLPLSELAAAFGFETMPDAKAFAGRTVRQILERQRADGGFAFWPESENTHPYLTIYVLWVLQLTKQHGVVVPSDVFERGAAYVRAIVNHPSGSREELERHGLSRDIQAFATLVLAKLGHPDLGAVERLANETKEMGLGGHAWLLMAAVESKAPEAVRELLRKRLESSIRLDGNRALVENADGWYLDSALLSPLTLQAQVLSALLAENPKHPLAGKLVAELLLRRESGTWRTTQESAYALLAIDQYWKAQEQDAPRFEARVWAGETELVRRRFEGRSTESAVERIDMGRLHEAAGLDVVFERASIDMLPASGTLFYEARLKYAPVVLPKVALDRGFSVQKTVRSVPVAELGAALATLGENETTIDPKEMMVVDLLVVAPVARRFVVVDDPMPAGVSAFDASLQTSSAVVSDLEGVRLTGFSSAWHRRELRDDRALFFVDEMPAGMYHYRYLARPHTPGRYVVPPTRAMEMYQPEVYGRTRAIEVTVGD